MGMVRRGQKGITLIEILVGIAIVTILAGVAVPVVVKFTGPSQSNATVADLSNIQAASDAMMVDNDLTSLASGCVLPPRY